MRLNINLRK